MASSHSVHLPEFQSDITRILSAKYWKRRKTQASHFQSQLKCEIERVIADPLNVLHTRVRHSMRAESKRVRDLAKQMLGSKRILWKIRFNVKETGSDTHGFVRIFVLTDSGTPEIIWLYCYTHADHPRNEQTVSLEEVLMRIAKHDGVIN